jgi:hypothetical protein
MKVKLQERICHAKSRFFKEEIRGFHRAMPRKNRKGETAPASPFNFDR